MVNLKCEENKEIKKEQKAIDPSTNFASTNNLPHPERRLFNKPFRIKFLMSQSEKNPFNLCNMTKRNFKHMNIMSLCGEGILMGEEDISFNK